MSGFTSRLAPLIEAFLDYYIALGHSRKTHMYNFHSIDRFFSEEYPCDDCLTQTTVMEWLDRQTGDLRSKATSIRMLGRYMMAVGKESFVLPLKTLRGLHTDKCTPYIFTDAELSALFKAVDATPKSKAEPFLNEIFPVMIRLIYTCGLRPNEGRELECRNVNLKNGEVLIVNTKHKKDRLVVMSGDMLNLCRNYNRLRAIFAKDNDYFFPSWAGCAFSNYQLTLNFRSSWARAYPDIENLPHVRVYDLRHRFASATLNRWLDNGQDLSAKLPYLRAYMGHNDLTDTLYYVHLLPENLTKSPGIDWEALEDIMPEVVVCPE